jgi:hypothetical protein
MTVASDDEEVSHLLRALGMPEHCVKFTLTAEVNAPLMAEATFYVMPNFEETVTKRYRLVEEDE